MLALDVSAAHGVLTTAGCDGEIKLWQLEGGLKTAISDNKPMTAAFLEMCRPIDSMASDDGFRTTDGKRWYDFDAIDEEELEEDAPPWAHIAKWSRQWKKDRE